MKADILKYKSLRNKSNSYLIAYKKHYIWINESDFIQHKNLLQIHLFKKPLRKIISKSPKYIYGIIELQEPLHQYYVIIQKENYKLLKPFTYKINTFKQATMDKSSPEILSGLFYQNKYKQLINEFIKIKLKSGKTVEEILMNNQQLNLSDLDSNWLSLYYELFHDNTFIKKLNLKRNELIQKKRIEHEKLIDQLINSPSIKKSNNNKSYNIQQETLYIYNNKNIINQREEKFINEMLKVIADKKTSEKKKNKILQLLKKYFKKNNTKEKTSLDITFKETNTLYSPIFQPSSKKHKPEDMIVFFRKFSTDEKFKWFTHRPDMFINRIDYHKIIDIQKCLAENKLFKSLIKCFDTESINLNISTLKFVNDFLAGPTLNIFYPEYKTFYTYGHPEIINKIKENINPFEIKVNDTYFVDIINRFKHAIEFRLDDDEYKFRKLMKEFIIDKLSIDIDLKFTNNFQLYSKRLSTYIDVNNFFRGMEIIMEWVNQYKNLSDTLIVDMIEKDNRYELNLFHPNSYINRDINSPKLNGLGGDLNRIRKYWFSVVDFEIQADIKTKNRMETHKIICLDKDTTMENWNQKDIKGNILSKNIIEKMKQPIEGVKYVIKIYKN